MSLKIKFFEKLFAALEPAAVSFSVRFLRACQNKGKAPALRGFRIKESGFKSSGSPLFKKIVQLYEADDPAVLSWLDVLIIRTFSPFVDDFGEPGTKLSPEETFQAFRKMFLKEKKREPLHGVAAGFFAMYLLQASNFIRRLPADQRTSERIEALYVDLAQKFNELLPESIGKEFAFDDEKASVAVDVIARPAQNPEATDGAVAFDDAAGGKLDENGSSFAANDPSASSPGDESDPAINEAAAASQTVFETTNPYPAAPDQPQAGRRRLLGCLRASGPFKNFFPEAEYADGAWRPIPPAEARADWPRYGAFNVYSAHKLSFLNGPVFIVDAGESDYDDNFDPILNDIRADFPMRVDAERLRRAGLMRPASEEGGFLIAYPEVGSSDMFNRITVRFDNPAENAVQTPPREAVHSLLGTPVLVRIEERLYGPFKLVEDSDGEPYVIVNAKAEGGIVRGFLAPKDRPLDVVRLKHVVREADGEEESVSFDFAFAGGLQAVLFDCYDDAALVRKAGAAIGAARAKSLELEAWLSKNAEQASFFTADQRIGKARAARLKAVLSRGEMTDELAKSTSSLLISVMKRCEAEGIFKEAALRIAEEHAKLNAAEQFRTLGETLQSADSQLTNIRAEFVRASKLMDAKRVEVQQQLIEENRSLSASIAKAQATLGNIAECADAIEMRNRLMQEAEAEKARAESYRAEIASLDEQLRSAVKNAGRHAFDGMIASRLQRAAADWERESVHEAFRSRAAAVAAIEPSALEGRKLAEHLVETFRATRPYDRNTVLSIFISIAQSFLTIFAGEPGTGKTSAALIAAHALGLGAIGRAASSVANVDTESLNRFLTVSVERGWTSKRDFLWFYNSLSGRFESPDNRRTDAFRQLSEEAELGFDALPYLMLLDEANLSPMEFYWADFMNVADRRSRTTFISLGDGERCAVLDTLRFLATINSDFTTESLSPRLIDRASVITLPVPDLKTLAAPEKPVDWSADVPIVDWRRLRAILGPGAASAAMAEKLDGACRLLAADGSAVSPRTMRAMLDFASAAAPLFEPKDGVSAEDEALDRAVAQKLLPKINGSGEAYRRNLSALLDFCEANRWRISAEKLVLILSLGAENMDDYCYF